MIFYKALKGTNPIILPTLSSLALVKQQVYVK